MIHSQEALTTQSYCQVAIPTERLVRRDKCSTVAYWLNRGFSHFRRKGFTTKVLIIASRDRRKLSTIMVGGLGWL
jgi:hypothetical protein